MNSRAAQAAAAALAFLLIILVGATIFILLSRPAVPGPTPTPSGGPTFTPTAGPSTSPTFLPTPSVSALPTSTLPPTDTPSPTTTPTPSSSPTPSPTPSPTLAPPTSPKREVTIVDLGFDQRSAFGSDFRRLQFVVDGPSLIEATLNGVNTGKVRMCISREAQEPERECKDMRGGTLSRAVFDAGQTTWNVTLIGLASAPGQYGNVTLEFNALSAELHLKSFRFNGTDDPHNNGFLVLFGDADTADGTFSFHADIDGHDNTYPWHFDLAIDDSHVLEQSGGPSASVDLSSPISGGTAYNLLFEESDSLAGGGLFPVFVDARLTWP